MIADTDARIRRQLDACDLPFEAGCLRPHEAVGAVMTVSAFQVRSPTNASRIDSWRRYARQLELYVRVSMPMTRSDGTVTERGERSQVSGTVMAFGAGVRDRPDRNGTHGGDRAGADLQLAATSAAFVAAALVWPWRPSTLPARDPFGIAMTAQGGAPIPTIHGRPGRPYGGAMDWCQQIALPA